MFLIYKTSKSYNNPMRLIIIGPMASGKSVVGRRLSKRMGLEFIDTDEKIEEVSGASISWIFDIEGEEKFRDRESKIFSELAGLDNTLLSTGGGIILRKENREILKKNIVIYLDVSIQTQLERTLNDEQRPLIRGKTNKEAILRDMADKRNSLYKECSSIKISEKDSPDLVVEEILIKLNALEDGNT